MLTEFFDPMFFQLVRFKFIIRLAIDQGEYKHLDNCKDVSLLCSAFKLFLRELPVPLITREARKALFASQVDFEQNADPKLVAEAVRKAVISLEKIELRVLKYVLRHMKRIADEKGNRFYKIRFF